MTKAVNNTSCLSLSLLQARRYLCDEFNVNTGVSSPALHSLLATIAGTSNPGWMQLPRTRSSADSKNPPYTTATNKKREWCGSRFRRVTLGSDLRRNSQCDAGKIKALRIVTVHNDMALG